MGEEGERRWEMKEESIVQTICVCIGVWDWIVCYG